MLCCAAPDSLVMTDEIIVKARLQHAGLFLSTRFYLPDLRVVQLHWQRRPWQHKGVGSLGCRTCLAGPSVDKQSGSKRWLKRAMKCLRNHALQKLIEPVTNFTIKEYLIRSDDPSVRRVTCLWPAQWSTQQSVPGGALPLLFTKIQPICQTYKAENSSTVQNIYLCNFAGRNKCVDVCGDLFLLYHSEAWHKRIYTLWFLIFPFPFIILYSHISRL